jgi:hypothetical protein
MERRRIFTSFLAIPLGYLIGCGGGSKAVNQNASPTVTVSGGHIYDKTAEEEPGEQPPAAPGPGEGGNPPEPAIKGSKSK